MVDREVTSFPLSWPEGLPRSDRAIASQFKTTLSRAIENVRDSLRRFGQDTGKTISNVILSSNVGGLSLVPQMPKDTGVAVWFTWDGSQRCIAVDRYPRPEDNLQAIHHILEARRTEMRHGGLHIVRQTFKGFTALPAPEQWFQILRVSPSASAAEIDAAYREKAKTAHPDRGGSDAEMARLNRARDEGRAAQ